MHDKADPTGKAPFWTMKKTCILKQSFTTHTSFPAEAFDFRSSSLLKLLLLRPKHKRHLMLTALTLLGQITAFHHHWKAYQCLQIKSQVIGQ